MSFSNETSCDSPFTGRLPEATKVINILFLCVGTCMITVTGILWHLKRDHMILAGRNHSFFIIQCLVSYSYLLYSLLFILDEPSPLTTCSASVYFKMSFNFVPMPAVAAAFSLIAKSKYNTKLIEHFDAKKYLNPSSENTSPLGSFRMEEETDQSNELKMLKFLSSPRCYNRILFLIWFSILLLTLLLERIICQGWFTGEKCDFEDIGLLLLNTVFLVFPVTAAIPVACSQKVYNNYVEQRWMKNYFNIGIVIELVEEFKQARGVRRKRIAKKILLGFIEDKSLGEINIDFEAKQKIFERFKKADYSSEMFYEAETEIISLLTFDSLPKFKASPYYVQAVHHYIA
eukprot:maker-scaffold_14-snap-gene-8.34-mRNA-1 protein AED:0.00 eAED:0.00 QI:59/1/1/1/0/0/2/46/344